MTSTPSVPNTGVAETTITEKAKTLDFDTVKAEIGEGPMRFALRGERSLQEQLDALTKEERACFDALKKKWEDEDRGFVLSDEMILRFARCSPGAKKFNEKSAWKVMKKYNQRYLTLNAASMEKQILSKTLFVVPDLKSKDGHDVFYMRPSLYFPSKTSTKEIIDNLVYCMQVMVEKEKSCTEGIAFMANMASWGMSNFSVSYCHQFMKMLQGRVPVRVRLFLIVNPPSWFDVIWKIMRPMLADDFAKKVHMIPDTELDKHLTEGYAAYLPDDIDCGKCSTDDIVSDFVTYRKYVESDAGTKSSGKS